jgi:hypothetical protein
MEPEIKVEGIKEVNKALRSISKDAQKELSKGMKEIAEGVAKSAASRVPARTGRAASSIKPRGSTKGAALAFGGAKAEHYPWLDFGGSVGKDKSVKRPFIKEGRYVYPAIRENKDKVIEQFDDLMGKLAEKHGLDSSGDGVE